MTRLQSRRRYVCYVNIGLILDFLLLNSINGGDIVRLKDKLRKFIKEVEIHQMSMSFRYEARYYTWRLLVQATVVCSEL